MRNLKRALSMALAAIMVLGLMVVGASAASYNDFTDKDEIKNTEAVNTMVSLGVISGKEDGSYYDPAGSLTRAEACTLIARMLGGGKDPVLGSNIKSNFSDTQGHWAESYIAYCANLGIIVGVGDGSFNPDGVLTGTAAAKMVLCALGYKPEFEGIGGANWELATNTLATKVKLYNGLETLNPSVTITRDDVAQLIYNGVQAQEVEYRNLQGDYSGTLYATDNGTMLANRFGVIKVEGIVLANDTVAVAGATAQEGKARLNGQYAGTYEVEIPNEMVGTCVVLYVQFKDELAPNAADSVVIGQPISSEKNTIVETSSRLKDADAVKSALRGAGIAMPTAGTAAYVRYTAGNVATGNTNGYAESIAAKGLFQRFIDNNNDGYVDYIIQEAPALAKVTAVNTSGEKITFSGTIGAQEFDDVVGYEDLEKGDYVLVVKYDDGKYHVSEAPTVEGEITAYTPNSTAVLSTITVDGTKYTVGYGANLTSDATIALSNGLIGDTYALYLDNYGNILGGKLVESSVGNYAVVLGASRSGNGAMGYDAKVKVLLADGTEVTYSVDLANTAVKLGLATASQTTTQKEAAATAAGYFEEEGAGANLAGKLFGYTLDDENVITLTSPAVVNDNYTTATFTANQLLKKSVASYGSSDGAVLADDNTIFFLANVDKNGAVDSYSVVTGLSALSASGVQCGANAGDVVYYVADGTTTKVAKAIWVQLANNTSYASSSNFAFISGTYTETLSGGTPIYTYPVVFEDGTVGTLSSKDANGVKNTVMEYTLDAKGYATLKAADDFNGRVDYVNGNTVSIVSSKNNAALGSAVVTSNTVVWNVTDTDNVYAGEIAENDVVAIVLDETDNTVKYAFVYDTMLGDMTANVALAGATKDSTEVTLSKPAAGQKVTVTFYDASAKTTTTLFKDVTAANFEGEGAIDGKATVEALAAGDKLTVTITENNKDTRTEVYEIAE